jgi:hypothetical protein
VTTARLLSERPLVEFDARGMRVLARDLVVDLGVQIVELHEWDAAGSRIQVGLHATTVIQVPAGLVYDGASIPWWAHRIAGAKERYEVAGVLHDALYRWQAPREPADRVFWIVARSGAESVGPARGWLTWAALRAAGWVAYRARG